MKKKATKTIPEVKVRKPKALAGQENVLSKPPFKEEVKGFIKRFFGRKAK